MADRSARRVSLVVAGIVMAISAGYLTWNRGADDDLAQVRRLVDSAAASPESIDRVRLELWPKLALLGPEDRADAFGILRSGIDRAQNPRVHRFMVESLGALGGSHLDDETRSSAVDLLLGLARDPDVDSPTRHVAITALPSIDTGPRVTAGLFEFASSAAPGSGSHLGQRTSLQQDAIRALGLCRTPEAGDRLFALLADEKTSSLFGDEILQSLAHIADARTQSLLVDRIRSGDKNTNELVASVQALGGVARLVMQSDDQGAEEARRVAEVRAILRDLCEGGHHPEIFSAAAIALARITSIDDAESVGFLEGLLPRLGESDRMTLASILEGHLMPARPSPEGN